MPGKRSQPSLATHPRIELVGTPASGVTSVAPASPLGGATARCSARRTRLTAGHYRPIYHVDIRFVRSKSFLPKPTSSLEKLRFYVGRCGKEYEFSLIK